MRFFLDVFSVLLTVFALTLGSGKIYSAEKPGEKPSLQYRVDGEGDLATIHISRPNGKEILVAHAPKEGRPYVHPIIAPDGKGVLTEDSPGHHKHQTGLFVGFLKVNGRDYFHNRGADHFRMAEGVFVKTMENQAIWAVGYSLLGKDGKPLLKENQRWTLTDEETFYRLDLDWTATAEQDVTFGKYDYGGLFLRMPWKSKTGGQAVNREGEVNGKAEGQKARWVDVGMPIEGRSDEGHIAILDHKDNPGHPNLWRVDGQLGVGPAPSRAGDWTIAKGKSVRLRYRLVIYTGERNEKRLEAEWKNFVGR